MEPPGRQERRAAEWEKAGPEGAGNGGNEMMHVLIAFELEEFGNGDAAVFANPAKVVSLQVGDHNQFRDLLGRGEEVVGVTLVELGIGPTGTGAFDRAGDDAAAAHS